MTRRYFDPCSIVYTLSENIPLGLQPRGIFTPWVYSNKYATIIHHCKQRKCISQLHVACNFLHRHRENERDRRWPSLNSPGGAGLLAGALGVMAKQRNSNHSLVCVLFQRATYCADDLYHLKYTVMVVQYLGASILLYMYIMTF